MSRAGKIKKAFSRFGRARDGATVVEFAMVAPWFFFLTFGLAEVAMVGFAQTTLDHAVGETARGIRTGEVQTNNVGYTDLKASLCSELNSVMSLNCSNLFLDVDQFDSFVDAQNDNPIQNGDFSGAGFGYNPGSPSSIVVVRAYYRWSVVTPMFKTVLGNVSSGDRILASTMMFRNEPYPES